MATPHVAGAAALLASRLAPNTADNIRAALQNTALDLGPSGRDPQFGYGLVQAYDALNYHQVVISPTYAFTFAPPGGVVTYALAVSNTGVVTDSYTVTSSSGAIFTTTITPDFISDLAPATAAPVTVTVAISDTASRGASEVDTVTMTSQSLPGIQATAALTTTVPYAYIFPIISR